MAPGAVRLLHLGFAAAVAQAVLLREAMAALVGSEVAWGAVVALWLAGMAIGARIGSERGSAALVAFCTPGVIAAAAVGTVLLRATPVLVGAAAGETVATWTGAWVWVIAVLPSAVLGGWCFPVLTPDAANDGQPGAAYALEGLGGVLGGLVFTLLLAPIGTAATLTVALAASVAVELRHRWLVAAAVVALGVTAAGPAGDWLAASTWQWAGHPGDLEHWRETRHQRLELGAGPPWSLYANGALQATYPDPWQVVPRAHLLALLHPKPDRVLLVGGLADGTLVPLLGHPVQSIDVAEEDPALPRLLERWYDPALIEALADQRVRIHTTDPLRAVRRGGPWELIVLLDSDPSTLRRGRTRTAELFATCQQRLADDGVLAVRVGVSDTYLGGAAGELLGTVAGTLRTVSDRVTALPGESILLLAGPGAPATIAVSDLETRWRQRGVTDPGFVPEMLELLVDPQRQKQLNAELDRRSSAPHTILRPRAVLPATALAEGRGGQPPLVQLARALANAPTWLLVIAVAAVVGAQQVIRAPTTLAASIGFVSMGWWLTLLAVWQVTVGSVYTEVGALTAIFMGGTAAGALGARWQRLSGRSLQWILLTAGALSLVMASGAAWRWPGLAVPGLLLAGGVLTGAAFPLVSSRFSATVRQGAGRTYAGEEAGAAAAAVVIGIAVLPWAGIQPAALALAAIAVGAAGSCFRGRPVGY